MRPLRHLTPRYVFHRGIELVYERRNSTLPWLTRLANEILSSWLRESDVGLEFGSGRSTIWFAKRVASLISVDHDQVWFNKVSKALQNNGGTNVRLLYIKQEDEDERGGGSAYVRVANQCTPGSLDFVLVDGIHRAACALATVDCLKPGGLLIIDDVHRYLPSDSPSLMARGVSQGPASAEWCQFLRKVRDWRCLWTSNGVFDTALFIKPCKDVTTANGKQSQKDTTAHRLREIEFASKLRLKGRLDSLSEGAEKRLLETIQRRVARRSLRHWSPAYAVNRFQEIVDQWNPDHPWFTKQSRRVLSSYLRPSDVGLEVGSGRSTLFLSQRVAQLTSLEHNRDWYQGIESVLKEAGISNVKYQLVEEAPDEKPQKSSRFLQAIKSLPPKSLDFAVVDTLIHPDASACLCLERIRYGGVLLVHCINQFLPCASKAPFSLAPSDKPLTALWREFGKAVTDWRRIWTSNGVEDTAIFFKPCV